MPTNGVGSGLAGEHQVRLIRGVPVVFPESKKPFSPQLALMSQAISALSTGRCALLESPTGTGKTLALLCSVLSWQEHDFVTGGSLLRSTTAGAAAGEQKPKAKRRRVFFMSRTHSQLTQVVHEMKRFKALGAAMTIIGSRQQYCVNSELEQSKSKSDDCKQLLSSSGCKFHSSHASMKHLMSPRVWDIEDLVTTGRDRNKCPYFAARAMVPESDLVFGPYNYVIDPVIRGDMDIKLKNAVLVFDEGHNILETAMDALSANVPLQALKDVVAELRSCAGGQCEPLAHTVVHAAINGLCAWVVEMTEILEPSDFEDKKGSGQNIWSGGELVGTLAARCKTTSGNIADLRANLDRCVNLSKEVGMAEMRAQHHAATQADHELLAAPHLSGQSISLIRRLIIIFENVLANDAEASEHFKVGILRSLRQQPNTPMRRFWGRNASGGVYEFSLKIWCLSASVAFREIFELAHSVIITSGTLSPMSSFAAELGHRIPIRLEAPHVIDRKRQLWVGTLGRGPRSVALTSSFKNCGSFHYQDGLGETIAAHLQMIPGGVLCFFPSYSLLDKCVKRWKSTKLLKKMRTIKTVVVEPRGSGPEFDACMKRFRAAVDLTARRAEKRGKAAQHTQAQNAAPIGKGGALFLAVCRGKLSEGIDFADRHARAVLVVGIPYPSAHSLDVTLKRNHCDLMHASDSSALTGRTWYSQQAFRALNQAVGRCIRHRDDYGAILLLDTRFRGQSAEAQSCLSKWLRSSVRHLQHYRESADQLRQFFETNVNFAAELKAKRQEEMIEEKKKQRHRKKTLQRVIRHNRMPPQHSSGVEASSRSDESGGAPQQPAHSPASSDDDFEDGLSVPAPQPKPRKKSMKRKSSGPRGHSTKQEQKSKPKPKRKPPGSPGSQLSKFAFTGAPADTANTSKHGPKDGGTHRQAPQLKATRKSRYFAERSVNSDSAQESSGANLKCCGSKTTPCNSAATSSSRHVPITIAFDDVPRSREGSTSMQPRHKPSRVGQAKKTTHASWGFSDSDSDDAFQ